MSTVEIVSGLLTLHSQCERLREALTGYQQAAADIAGENTSCGGKEGEGEDYRHTYAQRYLKHRLVFQELQQKWIPKKKQED